ncbi:MAG: hypothetical protein KJZ84_18055 [Bryobacteraceae bacterium]|nr:hypothetical protein [Bryobacteraceae bacterium]
MLDRALNQAEDFVGYSCPPLYQPLRHDFQFAQVLADPTGWYLVNRIPDGSLRELLHSRQPWFQCPGSPNRFVSRWGLENLLGWAGEEVPLDSPKGHAVIDHVGSKTTFPDGPAPGSHPLSDEHSLAPVCLHCPNVKDKDRYEIASILNMTKQRGGQIVVDGVVLSIAGVLRAKVQAGLCCPSPVWAFDTELWVAVKELVCDQNRPRCRDTDAETAEERVAERFADDRANLLGIIGQLGDIGLPVVRGEKVGLTAATHFPDYAGSQDRLWRADGRGGRTAV